MGRQTQFFYYLGLIFQLGLTFSISTFIGVFTGIFLDKKIGCKPVFTVIFLIFGIIGGFIGAYKLIKESRILKNDVEDKPR